MRYLLQAVIIAAVTFAAELIKYFVPLPVPASIYGLLLLFALRSEERRGGKECM